jgi:integrase
MSINKRGDSWRARYYGPDGREHGKSFKRKSDAERWLAHQKAQIAQGDWINPARGRITFGEFARDWLDGRTSVKPKTRHQQASILRLHVLPTWQAVQLDRITFEGLTRWVADLTSIGLGPSGIRQAVYLMSAILEHAVRSGRIRSNPARGLALPRPRRRDHVFLTHQQLTALADHVGNSRLLVLVLGYTGLRWGEATALRVCDIDLIAAASTCGAPSLMSAARSCSARPSPTLPAPSRCPGSSPPSWRPSSTARSLMTSCS